MAVITTSPRASKTGALVHTRSPEFRDRLDAAFDLIGHRSSTEFRDRLAAAFDRVRRPTWSAAIDAVNLEVGELALILRRNDPRRRGLLLIQDGLDELYRVELERERLVA